MPLSRINISASDVSDRIATRQHRIIHTQLCKHNLWQSQM
jgi:hypothetical protein